MDDAVATEPGGAEALPRETTAFDYAQSADVFTRRHGAPVAAGTPPADAGRARARSTHRNAITYRRFASGAAAIRFAIEQLSPEAFAASVIVSDGERHEPDAIRRLYASAGYPLRRRAAARNA